MSEDKITKWLEDTISDLFMDFLFYDRKEDEEMNEIELRELMNNGTITKELMIEKFLDKIEGEYHNEQ